MLTSAEVKFVRPTDALVRFIAVNMRQNDVDEVWASHRHLPYESLIGGWSLSHRSAVVMVNDEPCAMMGLVIHDILAGTGVPWMLVTDSALKYKRNFLTRVPAVMDQMLTICPRLFNYVHIENKTSIRWLRRIGFTFDESEPYGIASELFHRFHIERL